MKYQHLFFDLDRTLWDFEINAFKTQVISQNCSALSIECSKVKNFNEALKVIKNSNQKYFLITGSLYLIGRIRPKFL